MRCVTVSLDCAFGVDGSPFHEIGAWEFHGDVGLADEALESAEVDWGLDLLFLQHAHYKIIYPYCSNTDGEYCKVYSFITWSRTCPLHNSPALFPSSPFDSLFSWMRSLSSCWRFTERLADFPYWLFTARAAWSFSIVPAWLSRPVWASRILRFCLPSCWGSGEWAHW